MKTIFLGLLAIIATSTTFAQKPKPVSTLLNSSTSQIQFYYPRNLENVSYKPGGSPTHVDNSISKKEQMKREVTKFQFNPIQVQVLGDPERNCSKCKTEIIVDRIGSKQGVKKYSCTMPRLHQALIQGNVPFAK
jgi:putative DNA topoisomerase